MQKRPSQPHLQAALGTACILALMVLIALYRADVQLGEKDYPIHVTVQAKPSLRQKITFCSHPPAPPELKLQTEALIALNESELPDYIIEDEFPVADSQSLLIIPAEIQKAETKLREQPHLADKQQQATVFSPPIPSVTPHPPYPQMLRTGRRSGKVELRIHIDETGKPTKVEVLTATHPAFAAACRECILAKWLFVPAQQNHKPISSIAEQTIHFNI